MIYTLEFGSKTFQIKINQCNVKRFSISVTPNLDVLVKAPLESDIELIKYRIRRRKAWVARQIRFFEQFHPLLPDKSYVSGETHYYLGRQYRLKVRKAESLQHVRLIGRFFNLYLIDPYDNQKAKQMMDQWYSEHAKDYFSIRIKKYLHHLSRFKPIEPTLRCRKMKTRWGSCSPKGVITINTSLVKRPAHCIDYVIVHELCHLIFPNHTSSFYKLLEGIIPDWEKRKKRLESTFF